jgi:hypothetical protein
MIVGSILVSIDCRVVDKDVGSVVEMFVGRIVDSIAVKFWVVLWVGL